MSLRQLVEPECGGSNPLVRLGSHVTRDAGFKDEGISHGETFRPREVQQAEQFINEFLGQIQAPPQTFRMNDLLQEMHMIDASLNNQAFMPRAPNDNEVNKCAEWIRDFSLETQAPQSGPSSRFEEFWDQPNSLPEASITAPEKPLWVSEFFNETHDNNNQALYGNEAAGGINYNEFEKFLKSGNPSVTAEQEIFKTGENLSDDWLEQFQESKLDEANKSEEYNQRFWDKLQEEWKKMSEETDHEHPWLTEFTDYYDPYKEYSYAEENPMLQDENALEKGKAFLEKGDIPSAVLCFEAAAKQHPQDAEVWQLLGTTQAENEMDPNAIAALKKSLELQPNNLTVLMALAVSYTNESIQNQALKMLANWLHYNPKYSHLVPQDLIKPESGAFTGSLMRGPELREIQNLFLEAVRQNPNEIDHDIQEALGVLFNLSSEYDKAVDCFRAALQVRPDNAKIWNRLGASLANGNRSVEAVHAYQRALEIEPGFVRARYNVGIMCMNLKAYKEAAEHLLAALNLQATSLTRSGLTTSTESANQMSNTIWSTLRTILLLMGRRDLQEIMDAKDLNSLNQHFMDS